MQVYTEDEMIRGLTARNQSAFSVLYDNYSAALFGIILRIVGNNETAEDLLQDVIIKILSNIQKYDSKKGRLFTWMAIICKNTSLDHIRSKAARNIRLTCAENFIGELAIKDDPAEYDTIGIRKALLLLKPHPRLIIELAYFHGYTQSEMAEMLKIPLGTIKTHMRLAVKELGRLRGPRRLRA